MMKTTIATPVFTDGNSPSSGIVNSLSRKNGYAIAAASATPGSANRRRCAGRWKTPKKTARIAASDGSGYAKATISATCASSFDRP